MQVAALKNLGLNIRRAALKRDDAKGVIKHKFFITDRLTADKVRAPPRLAPKWQGAYCGMQQRVSWTPVPSSPDCLLATNSCTRGDQQHGRRHILQQHVRTA